MKNYLLSLLLSIPFLGISQTNDSWFKIEVQFDFYAPTESFLVVTQSGDTLINHQPTTNYEFFESIVVCDSGDMTLSLFDNFGDGWQSAVSNASVVISNPCQGVLLNLDVDSLGNFNQYDTVVNLLPCPPPVGGCTDPNASNYNPNAVFSDTSCLYDVHFTLNMNSYPDSFTTPYVAGEFNNWTDQHPMTDSDGDNVWEVTIPIPSGPHQWKFMLDNWADQELPPNVGSNPYTDCFILSFGFTNRTLYVPSMPVTLDDYCWESCYDCGTILGCTDSTSNLYNPWATLDDGTCSSTSGPSSCGPGETVLEIQFTPDNYPSESSWILYDDNGAVFTASQGTYNGATPGVPVSQFVCVDTNVLLDIVLNDSYGDGLCGTCFGGTVDGDVKVYDCNGNVLWQLSDSVANSNFGYQYTSPQFNSGSSCGSGTNTSIVGCMNPFSTTYNPLATVDDGTCGPPRVVGCTDSTSFNYDPNANTSEVMTGNYTLEIYDGQSNGWGGTWLGIKQGDWLSPQYKMGQQDGNMISFDVPLNIYEPIQLYLFTTPQSATSIAQVGYVLYGPEGDTIVDVPYWGAITLQFPIVQTTTAQPTFGDVCIPTILGCTDTNSLNYDPLANTDDGTCVQIVYGCTNPLAFNYDSTANVDDGSCIATVVGCMDSTMFNYDPFANTSGTCIPYIYGCTDSTSFNYNPNANVDDGSCVPVVYGCTDVTAFNYDSTANTDDGTCIARVYGCTDSTALNYDPLANTDNGSCVAIVYGCMTPTSINYNPLANVNDGSCIPFIYGCTDSTSFNYNPLANTDDSSCVPIVYGCTTPTATNYDPLANTDDGSCIQPVYGCTDSTAFNYNPLANTDNGSCVAKVYGCTTPSSTNYDPSANTDDGSCIPIIYGCTDSTSFNYNPLANTDNGSCVPIVLGCTTPTSINYNPSANTDDGSCIPFIYGCTDSTSFNYNPLANTDDSSCVPIVLGCTTPTSINYDPLANTDDGSCVPYIYGCTDSTAFNYNPLANTDNGTCIAVVYGCTNPNSTNYNPAANVDDSTCIPIIYGCTDTTAFNYNPLANTDNGSCIARVYGCTNVNSTNYNPLANTDDGSCIPIIYGCTDTTAFNYNPLANTDNGSCIPKVYGCTNPASINYNANANTDDGSCIPFIYGCTDSTSFNYNPLANTDDGTCVPFIYGCTDPNAFNYDPSANTNQVSATDLSSPCIPVVYGCTDSTAVNFDPNANVDNGTCITAIYGCTDPNAYNYNPNANVSDTTACLYDAGCIDGPGNPYWLNDPCYAWVIDVDEYCCTNSWDTDCQSLYDYCAIGSGTVDLEEIEFNNIVVYPNPTTGMLNIKTNLNVTHVLYDFTGRKITQTSNEDYIDITYLPNGVYFLSIRYGDKVFNKRIVKED